jgi:T5orf172 domain
VKPTAIYLIKSDQLEGVYKVGLSDLVPRRSTQIRAHYGLGGSVEAEAWFPSRSTAQEAERAWHRFLAPLRDLSAGGREWFRMSEELIATFKQWTSLSPNGLPLRMQIKSGRLTPFQAEQLSTKLLRSIPYAERLTSGGKT